MFSFIEPALEDTLERERDKFKSLSTVELILELHPRSKETRDEYEPMLIIQSGNKKVALQKKTFHLHHLQIIVVFNSSYISKKNTQLPKFTITFRKM